MTDTDMTVHPEDDHSYDKFANFYAQYATAMTRPHAIDLIGMAEPQIRHAKRILELGCGSGVFGSAYQQWFPDGIAGQTIVCTDLSPAMVDLAKNAMHKSTSAGQTNFIFQVADAANLAGMEDQSFDMVISLFGVFIVPDQAAMVREVRRVLKNGGTLATTSWTSTGHDEGLKTAGFGFIYQNAWGAMKPAQKATTAPPTIPPSLAAAMEWFDRDKIRALLQGNDRFDKVTIRCAIHTTTFADVEYLWSAMTSSNPYGAAYANEGPERVAQAKALLGQYVAPDGDVDAALFTFLASNLVVASLGNDSTYEAKKAKVN